MIELAITILGVIFCSVGSFYAGYEKGKTDGAREQVALLESRGRRG